MTKNGPLIAPFGPMIERTWLAVNVAGFIGWSNVTSMALAVLFRTRLLPVCADPAGSETPIRLGAEKVGVAPAAVVRARDQFVSEPTFAPVAVSTTVRIQMPLTGAPSRAAVSVKVAFVSPEPARLPCAASVVDTPLGAVRTSESTASFG